MCESLSLSLSLSLLFVLCVRLLASGCSLWAQMEVHSVIDIAWPNGMLQTNMQTLYCSLCCKDDEDERQIVLVNASSQCDRYWQRGTIGQYSLSWMAWRQFEPYWDSELPYYHRRQHIVSRETDWCVMPYWVHQLALSLGLMSLSIQRDSQAHTAYYKASRWFIGHTTPFTYSPSNF